MPVSDVIGARKGASPGRAAVPAGADGRLGHEGRGRAGARQALGQRRNRRQRGRLLRRRVLGRPCEHATSGFRVQGSGLSGHQTELWYTSNAAGEADNTNVTATTARLQAGSRKAHGIVRAEDNLACGSAASRLLGHAGQCVGTGKHEVVCLQFGVLGFHGFRVRVSVFRATWRADGAGVGLGHDAHRGHLRRQLLLLHLRQHHLLHLCR